MYILLKNKTLFLFLACSFQYLLFGQEQTVQKDSVTLSRHYFSVEIGLNKELTTGNKYIKPAPLFVVSGENANKYAGFTKFHSFGLQLNIHYDYAINHRIRIKSGLAVSNGKRTYESDSATLAVIEQNYPYIQYAKPYIVKYDFNPINLEIPVCIGYELERFSVYLGIKAKIATYNISSTKDVSNSVVTNKNFSFEVPKTIRSYSMIFNLYYHLISDKLKIFTGIDSGIYPGYTNNFYWQLGINVPIMQIN